MLPVTPSDTLRALTARDPLPADCRDDLSTGLNLIGDRAEALTRFMLGYTTLARLPPPAKRATDISALFGRVAQLQQGVRVICHCDSVRDVLVDVDPDQIEQALINLLKNAAEAIRESPSPPGTGRITVDAGIEFSAGRPMVHLRVVDNGVGISPEHALRLFECGFSTKSRSSSGLGLHWCAVTTTAMSGQLHVESAGVGQGACLHLLLPP